MTPEPAELTEQANQAYKNKKFLEAAELFNQAADGFKLKGSVLMAAEMKNNTSVAFLQAGKPQDALNITLGTDIVFGEAGDIKKQGMVFGNQAAALEALNRYDEAVTAYEHAAELFAQAKEGDLRAMVMKSAAAIKLKTGKITESTFKMIGSLDVKDNPSLFERVLSYLLRFIIK